MPWQWQAAGGFLLRSTRRGASVGYAALPLTHPTAHYAAMTETPLRMPKLGLTMTEGTLSQWLIPPGSAFRRGDLVAVVETDKIASDLEAPADGELLEVLVREGETVPVGALLARCRFADDAGLPGQDEPTTTAAATPQMVAEAVPASPDAVSAPAVPALMNTSAATIGGRVVATP